MTENEHSLRSGASYVRTCTTRGCNGESGGNTLAQNPPQLRRVCLRPIERNTPPTRAFCTPLSCADETGTTRRRPKKRDIVAATCTLHSTTRSQTYTGYPDWGVAKGAGKWEATGMDNLICPDAGGATICTGMDTIVRARKAIVAEPVGVFLPLHQRNRGTAKQRRRKRCGSIWKE